MWRGVWLLYCLFIDRLLSVDSDMELRDFKDISMNSGRRFAPFKLESTNDQDNRLDRTTTSIPRIALKDWMEKNPNLKKLAMFGTENQVLSDLEVELEESEKTEEQLPKAEDDNFHHMYIEVNRTLFAQTDMPDEEKMAEIAMSTPRRRMPTGRALSDRTNPAERIPLTELNEFATSTESNPFEVTEALMRDLTQIGDGVLDTVAPTTKSTLIDRPFIPITTPSTPSIHLETDPSTPRPPYYRIPDTIGIQREAIANRVEGEATLSIPPKEFINSNDVVENANDNEEELPFVGDATTFEIPTASPRPHSIWNTKTTLAPFTFSFTPSPIERDPTHSVVSSFRDKYFGTTEPSIDPPSLEQLQKGFEREELVLFNSPEGTPLEGLNMNWSPLPSTTPKLLPRRVEKYHSGGMKRGDKKKKKNKRTKKIQTANYALSLNSQTATNFDVEDDTQLRLDLERELRLLNKEQENGKKSRTKGALSQKVNGVSKSWGRSGGKKHKEIEKDPLFAMEMEVLRTKKLREQMNWNPANRKEKRMLHKKFGRTSSAEGKRIAPLSQARMVSRGDRMVEQRISMIGGQKITVDLANPALHGADLMMNPGAVIHDLLDPNIKTDERKEIDGDIFPSKWKGREQSSENETPTWNQIYDHQPHFKYIGEFADPEEKVITNIDESGRIEIETFDGSQFDRPSKCCDENEIEGNHPISKGEVESLDALLIPLNSDNSRRTQTTSLYGQVNLSPRSNASDPERYIIKKCFEEKRNCYLIDASPMERRIGLTSMECLRFCSRVKGCLSVSFASTLSICDIYNIRNGTGTANLVQLLGYMYYEPKVTDIDKCMSAHAVRFKQQKRKNIRRTQAKKRIQNTTPTPIDPMIVVNAKRGRFNMTMANRARCPTGEEMLFIRSRGIRDDGGNNLDTVLNINEDDCIFSCISNLAGYYDIFDCVSAQYDSYNEACTLSSDPPKDGSLSLHSSTNFYEKICTKSSITSRCSGGTVERKRQKVLTGLLRDSITVGSSLECIERCIDVHVNLPFKCMSIAYYYEEVTFNCVLNDGSALTHPDSLFDESSSVVDYFGIDECHGIREITHRINDDYELRNFVHDGGLIHKRAERPLPPYEQARI